jgi:transcriptional regulator with XRE-family HTH domain
MKLRSLRTQKRLTLSRLAVETGLSTALLSKLETERMIPTLPTLATICRVYGVGISYFFSDPTLHSLSITRKAHLQGNSRTLDSAKCTPLNSSSQATRLIAQMIELPSAGATFITEPGHETCGFVYVLEGRLQVDAGGMQQILEPGDCAYIESEMPLACSAAGNHRCRALAVVPAGLRTEPKPQP